jgi:GT2 family glycosyltransferase/glycosyltransferase involved in cell wall biosynthesis/SAM-dependent methyltransferase
MTESPYNYQFDPDGNSTAARVVRNVGHEKYVLELGCAYGVMSKVLVEYSNCRIFGVEFDEKSAEHARPYCSDLKIQDIENANWDEVFEDKRFDVILAADVLEHLRDPQKCLVSLRKFLSPGGYLVLSLPNVAHNGIISELLSEDFRYRKTGLLDATHLRFWGAEGVKRLLSDSGFVISKLEMMRVEPEQSEFADTWASLPKWMTIALRSRPEGNVYQYIVKALPIENRTSGELTSLPIQAGLFSYGEIDRRIAELEQRADEAAAEAEVVRRSESQLEALVQQMANSLSWRLTRPLRFVARLARQGLSSEDRQRLAQILRHRYHSLPLPGPAKSVVSFTYHRVLSKIVRILRRYALQARQFHAPTIRPLAQTQDMPDYIVWGVVDWHYRHQRPQQLALALVGTGRRVFYISPALVDDERGGFTTEALDSSGQLFQIRLFAAGSPSIYTDAPSLEIIAQLRRSIGEVLDWADCGQIISLVDHPFWLDIASVLPNSRLVYDCMDHHEGFGNNAEPLLQLEKRLLVEAKLTITTSTWLYEVIAPHAKYRALIRNASDYEHFAKVPDSIYRDPQGRQIIGYYGAIAEWFDLDLIEAVAKQHPDCCVLLIGSDTVNARSRLAKLNNVTLTGEVSYNQLPHFLHGFAVCLLPFKVIPLTLATNPVKAYEYLSAGKPVVAVDLPEMAQFDGLMYRAADNDAFLAAVRYVLSKREPDSLVQNRKIFAQGQTWQHRAETLIQHVESTVRDPRISIVVVTYNNLELTRACLASLDEHSQYECMEIIVVDNASSDSSPTFLSEWAAGANNRKLILNDKNRGFAAANNQGLANASGDYLVLLNNDTYVTPGWVRTLMRHLERDRTIGLIGPVTNNIGNEAKIDITYEGMDEMLLQSAVYTRRHIGQAYPMRTVAFFCVMMPRTTYERVGTLDEAFGRGFFEDDDYCRRVEQLGLRIVCAKDVFIHHHLSASFSKLKRQDRRKLFEENKIIYEAKWGEWIPHGYRKNHQSEVNE